MPPGTSSQIISGKSSYWSLTCQADCMRVFSGYPHSNPGIQTRCIPPLVHEKSELQEVEDLVSEGVGNGTQQSDSRAHMHHPFISSFFFLTIPCGLWDLSSLARDGTNSPQDWEYGVLTNGLPMSPFFILHLTEVMCEHLPSCSS